MSLESGTVIQDLDETSPSNEDDLNEGDNHITLIKSILKTQFPGSAGQGYSIPIVANEQELNWSQNLRDNIQLQLDALDARIIALESEVNVLKLTGG